MKQILGKFVLFVVLNVAVVFGFHSIITAPHYEVPIQYQFDDRGDSVRMAVEFANLGGVKTFGSFAVAKICFVILLVISPVFRYLSLVLFSPLIIGIIIVLLFCPLTWFFLFMCIASSSKFDPSTRMAAGLGAAYALNKEVESWQKLGQT